MSFPRLLTIVAALAIAAPLAPLAATPAAAHPRTEARTSTGCAVSGQGVYTRDSCSIGTARTDYAGITFSHVDTGTYAYCTSANQTGGCIQQISIEPGDYGPNSTDGLSCDFQPAPDEAEHLQYTLHYPQTGGANDAYAVQAEGGFSCQSTDVRGQIVYITLSPCGYSGATCPPGLTGDPGLQTHLEIDYNPGHGPVAAFTSTVATTPPNTVAFDASGSNDASGTIASYAWEFGDSSTSTKGPTVSHAYATGGMYTTTLTITDSNGQTASVSKSVVVDADLTSAIAVTDPQGQPLTGTASAVGNSLLATVTLSASATAAAPITGVVPAPVLAVTPDKKLTQSSMPALPAGGYTIAPGQSISYSVSFVIDSGGSVSLSMSASGMEGAYTESTTAQKTVQLGQPLQVDINLSQLAGDLANSPLGSNTIQLDDDDNGEVPQAVTAVVTVTNVSTVAQTNVTLADTPDLSVKDPASNHIPFPVSVSQPVGAQASMGTLAPGAFAKATMLLQVTGNNVVHISQLVLSGDADTGTPEKSFGAADLTALPTALALVDMKPDASVPSHIITGRLLQFNGTVTNLSNTQGLDLDPVLADITGNGGGQTVADAATATADGYLAPVTGKLAPGDKATFHVLVQTIANAGTRTTISFAPTGHVIQADGTEVALTPKQIRVTAEASPKIVSLDDSADKPIDSPGALTVSYVFTAEALDNLRDWAADGLHSVKDVGNLGIGTIGDGVVAAGGILVKNVQANLELASLIKAELALHVFFSFLTPAQLQDFGDQVALDAASADAAWTQFHGALVAGFDNYVASFSAAFESGDSLGAARILGGKIGYGVPEVLSTLAPDLILNKVARGLNWGTKVAGAIGDSSVARLISLGGKIKESGIVLKAAKALEGVTAGDNLLANSARVLKSQFGLTQRDIDILRNLASREKLLIAVRQRNPISTAWLKTGKFLAKPELIKLKNVDEIDVKFLGYLGKGGPLGIGDLGTVVLKEPDSLKTITRRLVGQNAEMKEAVLARYKTRVEEWKDYEKAYKQYAKQLVVDVGFDKAAQGAGAKGRDLRKFALESVTGEGTEYYRVLLSDARGVLKGITGDIDIVAILNADGSVLNAAARAKIYDALQKAIGMAHGESFSWQLLGEFLSNTKAKLLADHLPGRELLAVMGPDGGARAAYFDPKLTVFNAATKQAVATFVGAYCSPLTKAARIVSINLGIIR